MRRIWELANTIFSLDVQELGVEGLAHVLYSVVSTIKRAGCTANIYPIKTTGTGIYGVLAGKTSTNVWFIKNLTIAMYCDGQVFLWIRRYLWKRAVRITKKPYSCVHISHSMLRLDATPKKYGWDLTSKSKKLA